MSKFIQRIGTASTKFAIEIHLTKVEISLLQQCRVSVTFKRGEHVKETKTQAPLINGEAIFDDRLNIPATLYYDKKKDGYLSKDATLSLNIITANTTRLAGLTKIDLAHYANLGLQEQEIVLKVDKCFDKNAKFHFTMHMIPLTENSMTLKKSPFSRQNLPDTMGRIGQDLYAKKHNTDTGPHSMQTLDHNVSADSRGFDGISNITVDNSRLQPGQNAFRKSRSPIKDFDWNIPGQTVPNRRSRTVDFGKDSESSIELSGGMNSQTNVISEKSYEGIPTDQLEKRVAELESQVKVYEVRNKNLEQRASINHQNYVNANKEFEEMRLQYEKMKVGWHFDNQETTAAETNKHDDNQIHEIEANYHRKVQELEESHQRTIQQLEDSHQRAAQELENRIYELTNQLTQYQSRNSDLEEENNRVKYQLEESQRAATFAPPQQDNMTTSLEVNSKYEEYENTIRDLQEKLRQADERGTDHTAFIREADLRVQEANEQIEEAEKRAKKAEKQAQDLEKKLKDLKSGHEHELSLKDKRVEDLQQTVRRLESQIQEREQKVEDLETLSRSYTSEIEALKRVTKANSHDEDEIRSLKEEISILQRQNKSLEESYKKRIEELSKQNSELKRELENAKSELSTKDIENENTVAKIGLENDRLKKQVKELNAKILTMQYEGNEVVHLRERIEELKSRIEQTETELSQAKMRMTNLVVEKENVEKCFQDSEDNNSLRQKKIDKQEKEIFVLKARFGELMNSIMEYGDEDLLDRMEAIIAAEDIDYLRTNSRNTAGGAY